jgi:hypothetical protein
VLQIPFRSDIRRSTMKMHLLVRIYPVIGTIPTGRHRQERPWHPPVATIPVVPV